MVSKKVLFLQGSPRGTSSASFKTATYMSRFLESEVEFIDVDRAGLSADPTELGRVFKVESP